MNSKQKPVSAGIAFALFLIAATGLMRWPGMEKEFWNVDEAVTFTMARQILAGDIPYRDAVDQRNPLAPYLQAAVFGIAGKDNLKAQHLSLALLIGLSAIMLWRMTRHLLPDGTGISASLWFVLLCMVLPTVRDTMPAHTAWYLIFFSIAGFYGLARAWHSPRSGWALASGLAFSFSVLAKQPGLLDFGVALVLIVLGWLIQPDVRKRLIYLLGSLLIGFTLPLALTGVYFAAHGALQDLIYYTWTYNNTLYVPEVPLGERWQTIRVPFELAWKYHPLVPVIGVMAAVLLLGRVLQRTFRRPRQFDLPGWLILGWCASGLVSSTLSGRGFSHYSIQLIPGLSLACGWLTMRTIDAVRHWAGPNGFRRGAGLATAAVLLVWLLFPLSARLQALNLPDPGSDAITELVRRQSALSDRIFVWGYNPEIYATSGRLPATRFLYCTFLTGLIPWTNLDPLKNTDYAVVPGAWEDFLSDWNRHPPTLVADGRSQRGFLKYPLENQPLLWPLIERNYAQIEIEATAKLGFWLFRQLEQYTPGPIPGGVVSGEIQLQVIPSAIGHTARVTVQAPTGTRYVELYLDGTLYRRLQCAPEAAVSASFFVLAVDRPDSVQRVQALAIGEHSNHLSAEQELGITGSVAVAGGPPLFFSGKNIAALESSTINGNPILPKKDAPEHWDAHPPSRLVYPWLEGMNSLAFAFGIEESALGKVPPNGTDGIEVIVQTEDLAGKITTVYRNYVDREIARRSKGRVVGFTPLPTGGTGRIILQMTPRPRFDVAFDWGYWLWLRADQSPIALLAGGSARLPVQVDSPSGLQQAEFNGQFITLAETPTSIDFLAAPDFSELSGSFGVLDRAWLSPATSGPVNFSIMLLRPDAQDVVLLERQLDSANLPDDRGSQVFKVALPQPLSGVLRLGIRAGDQSPMQGFWSRLSATTINLSLKTPNGEIPPNERSRSDFGFNRTVEDGKPCLFAHANTTLVYPWREGLRHLTGEFGLIHGAYATGRSTDGVVFIIEIENADGERRELFRRHLAPVENAEDRGVQQLAIDLPAMPGGSIIVRTAAPPSGHLNNAWSYWRDLHAGP